MIHRPALPLALCLTFAACGGGGGDDDPAPLDATAPPAEEPVDDPLLVLDTDPGLGEVGVPLVPDTLTPPEQEVVAVEPGTGLRVDTRLLCPTVGESAELAVTALSPETDDGAERERRDVTASVNLSARHGDSLEVLSQGDEAIAFRMNRRDIIALDIALEDEASLTVRVAGFAADAPPDLLMRKPVAGGCLYALRLAEPAFCGTARVRGGQVSLGSGGTVVALDGCEYEAPDGLPVVELPPERG